MGNENSDELNQGFLDDIPDRFSITEEEIDPFIHDEYYSYVSGLDIGQYDEDDILRAGDKLIDSTVSLAEKKKIIAILAKTGTVKAYRTLERYVIQAERDLKDWSRAGLYRCRMLLERSLDDKRSGMISTGLGGKGDRLRYVVVMGYSNPDLHSEQKRIIEESFQRVCYQYESEAADIHFRNSYVKISLLVSMDVAVGDVIEESIPAANEKTSCLYDGYFVTNVKRPTEEAINQYLKDLREKDQAR